MIPYRAGLFTLTALGVALVAPVCAGPPEPNHDARRLAARIDELIEKRLADAHVQPAPRADDGVVLRRLTLDVAGKAPRVADVRRFLEAERSDKHERAVEVLLESPGYARHFSGIWSDLLIPEAKSDFQKRYLVPSMEAWLREQFADNVPYDRMVREILNQSFGRQSSVNLEIQFAYGDRGRASPVAFYQTKLGKPEDLAASTARLFLGVRLECAQCHDHPFGKWTREEFWGLAAFYAGLSPVQSSFQPIRGELTDRRELAIPGTERVAQARFLDGNRPRWKFKVGARDTLAEWLTARDNPFFARAAANRMWEHFFGIGLVDPVDDFREDNPPSHPELLDLLAREFAGHDFDLKFLIRAITYSKTYQRASTTADRVTSEDRLFARMAVRALTAEQLYDSIVEASGLRGRERQPSMRIAINGPQQQFLDKFDLQQERTEPQTSIPQALAMMNSELVRQATNPDRGPTLAAVAAAPFLSTEEKVETLYLAALGRKPRPEEAKKFVEYVEKGVATGNGKRAFGDVFWALLNSTEFYFNH